MYKSNCQSNSRPVSTSIKCSEVSLFSLQCSFSRSRNGRIRCGIRKRGGYPWIEIDLDEDNNLAIETI